MLIKLTLLNVLIKLNIVSFSKNSEHFVIYFPYSFIWIFNQFKNLHEDCAFIKDSLQSYGVKDKAVYGIERLTNELWIVLFSKEQSKDGLK
jgi:hypothetical protein